MTPKYDKAVPQPPVAPPLPLKDFDEMFNDEEKAGYLPEKVDHHPPKAMKRKLKERQLTMMSIGGTIGTGLFLGMGSSLNDGGPMGLLLGYLIMWVHQQNILFFSFGWMAS
jgi:amino acid permease